MGLCRTPGGTAAKVFIRHHNVAGLYPSHKVFIDILHTMGRQFLMLGGVEIPCRDDNIRVHVVPVFMYPSFGNHTMFLLFTAQPDR